jgi:hypothetical protein
MKLVDGRSPTWTATGSSPLGSRPARLQGRPGAALQLQERGAGAAGRPVFDKIAGNLVDAFVKRAEQMYG